MLEPQTRARDERGSAAGRVDNFIDYSHVHIKRALGHFRSAGLDPADFSSPEQLAETEERYKAVRDRYLDTICKACGTTRDGISWTKLSLPAMATHVGIGKMYLALAYWPTLRMHTTVQGLANWMEEGADGQILVGMRQQHDAADAAAVGAHLCATLILEEHVRYFKLDVDTGEMRRIMARSWPSHEELLESSS